MIVYTLLTASAWIVEASAAPQQLNCILTDTEAQPGSENRPIIVVFDEDAKTLTAKDGDHTYSFSNISISNVSINGLDDTVSLGIDRSSFGIVWQQYGADKLTTEFGHCPPAPAPKPK
ncbi:MAG: hypothetical protein P4L80_09390 [Xanthobacteraceae bacterium]|nr:hypothetical protein [Xanthobacteraceae bacterium]